MKIKNDDNNNKNNNNNNNKNNNNGNNNNNSIDNYIYIYILECYYIEIMFTLNWKDIVLVIMSA